MGFRPSESEQEIDYSEAGFDARHPFITKIGKILDNKFAKFEGFFDGVTDSINKSFDNGPRPFSEKTFNRKMGIFIGGTVVAVALYATSIPILTAGAFAIGAYSVFNCFSGIYDGLQSLQLNNPQTNKHE